MLHYNIKNTHLSIFKDIYRERSHLRKMFLQKETCRNRKARIHIAIFKVLYCLRVTRGKTPPAVTCCLVTAGGVVFVHKESALTANLKKNLP